ncbi:hypothetical protein [Streptomyces sp. NRRL F-5123]|uniref:hypothetical protein n=1 Tax=Streptomyces sp. NRRL F-5123 TaxID=1463856 RepID=UPI0004E26013|nr:hypothetical protein [Streptomyces sp. NRRL F-5123]
MRAPARLAKLALTLGSAAVLAVGMTTDAHAATGAIRYFDFAQHEFRIDNPPDNVCLNLQFHAWLLANDTDKTLSYFFGANCTNFTGNLDPGRAVTNQSPLSVRIIG